MDTTDIKPISELAKEYRELFITCSQEQDQRELIIHSTEYMELQKQIDELTRKQEQMLEEVPNSSGKLSVAKLTLLDAMNAEGIQNLDGFQVRTRETKQVNKLGVYHALDDDLDQFFLLCDIKQKNLNEYAKDHPDLKPRFKDCIETDTISVTDVTPA